MQEYVDQILNLIEQAGFEAYLVGGSVRDYLLEIPAADVDLATNATPEQVKAIFSFTTVLDTGIKHGTVTVMLHQLPFEITTYRSDSTYSDHRRPDEVSFARSITEDLSRRDFTINAMAYHPKKGLIDPFGGSDDLVNGLLKAVGDPAKRFEEDPLRILRGLRFISRFGLQVEEKTDRAMRHHSDLLFYISAERIFSELKQILMGPAIEQVLLAYPEVFSSIIPELSPMMDFDQQHPHHHKQLWDHTARVVAETPIDISLRLAALFHDIAKPEYQSFGKDNHAHYIGHPERSDEMSRQILRQLRADNKTLLEVSQLIRYHDHQLSLKPAKIREWLQRLGPELLSKLIDLKAADAKGQHPDFRSDKLEHLRRFREEMEIVRHGKAAFTVNSLEINGHDLIDLGFPQGRTIGLILERLLKEVMTDSLPNERQALIDRAYQLK
ncbi:MAG TPA: CCA tRNA nucleotidyltransferase [Tissierellia bacterium]|nr:CCA tRNA nucleotidyltransferase [Tissierellia bacterium]